MNQRTDPNRFMLAEQLAQHFADTLAKIKRTKGKHVKPWNLIKREERQDLIETFVVILAAADEIEEQDRQKPKVLNPVKNPLR